MTVPSYDDLTPGIPDVADSATAGNLASLLRELPAASSQLPASGFQLSASGSQLPATGFQLPASSSQLPASGLYACLRLAGGERDAGSWQQAALAIARDFSPRVRQASERDVLVDVSGLGRLIGEPPEIARQLTRAVEAARLQARVAVAPTQTIARVLAHAETAGGPHAWRQIPVGVLRELEALPPGLNHRDRDRPYEIFAAWGIATLGDLAALPPGDLSSRLGRRGVALHRLARGLDPAPFVPDPGTPRYLGQLELEWPLDALEPLSFVLARLLDPLAISLERADRGAAAIRLDLRLTDRSTEARVLQLPAPMRDPRVLRTLLLLDLESQSLFRAAGDVMIDAVTIELDPAPARITQFSLLQRALPSPETLSTLTARLSALVGAARVGSPALLDSHRPDAFEMVRFSPESHALSPSRRANVDAMLRRHRLPLALHVSVDHGRPVHIASSRRGIPYGAIIQAAGPWRTSGGWWTDQAWNRNDWDVALKSGAVCRIYQDRTTNRWFLEGVYD